MVFSLSRSKRIFRLNVHRSQRVVDNPVMSLVGSDREEHVPHQRIGGQLPILDGQIRSGQTLPHRETSAVQLLQDMRVRNHRLLLEVPDESGNRRTTDAR